jgi:hypothetical protein
VSLWLSPPVPARVACVAKVLTHVPARLTRERGGLRAKPKMEVASAIVVVVVVSTSVIAAEVLWHASARVA